MRNEFIFISEMQPNLSKITTSREKNQIYFIFSKAPKFTKKLVFFKSKIKQP